MIPTELPVPDLARCLREEETKLEEYFDAALAHIAEQDPSVRALLPEPGRRERLLDRARQLRDIPPSQRPPLFGVLIGVKDIMKVSGLSMQVGSRLPEQVFEGSEARIVSRLCELGAVVLGRTVTTEFAYFAPGPTRNPSSLEHTPGGSSSGSAAAVAAGYCPLALGTQTIGSVSRPAAFCGIVGVKPSAGTLPRDGIFPFSPTADQVGYFVRSMADAGFILELLLPDSVESSGSPTRPRYPDAHSKPRFAAPHDNYLSFAEPTGRKQYDATLETLSDAGAEIVATPGLEDFERIKRLHRALIAGEFARVHQSLVESYESLYSEQSLALVEEGKQFGERELEEARESCMALRRRLDAILDERGCEAWLSPAAPSVAPRGIERTGDPVMNLPWTHAGVPSLSLPSGRDSRGLAFGLQVAGRFNDDRNIASTGQWLEERLRG